LVSQLTRRLRDDLGPLGVVVEQLSAESEFDPKVTAKDGTVDEESPQILQLTDSAGISRWLVESNICAAHADLENGMCEKPKCARSRRDSAPLLSRTFPGARRNRGKRCSAGYWCGSLPR